MDTLTLWILALIGFGLFVYFVPYRNIKIIQNKLDKFDDEIYEYIYEKKLNSHTVDEIMKNFESTGKNFDKKIVWEIILIKKLHGKQKKFKKN